MMRKAGCPICLIDKRGVSAIQHQWGTLRFGADPTRSDLDRSLTILAQALRASEHLAEQLKRTPASRAEGNHS